MVVLRHRDMVPSVESHFERKLNSPHCVQYCQVQLIEAGSENLSCRLQSPMVVIEPEQFVVKYELTISTKYGKLAHRLTVKFAPMLAAHPVAPDEVFVAGSVESQSQNDRRLVKPPSTPYDCHK